MDHRSDRTIEPSDDEGTAIASPRRVSSWTVFKHHILEINNVSFSNDS